MRDETTLNEAANALRKVAKHALITRGPMGIPGLPVAATAGDDGHLFRGAGVEGITARIDQAESGLVPGGIDQRVADDLAVEIDVGFAGDRDIGQADGLRGTHGRLLE